MYRRLAVVSDDLTHSGQTYKATHEQMLQRMVGVNDLTSLKVLASAVEPPKEYARESLASYDSFIPLNKMVDAIPPESNQAREFHHLASLIAAGKASPEQWEQAREWLILWRDNDAALRSDRRTRASFAHPKSNGGNWSFCA
jgi:hexosaminidase